MPAVQCSVPSRRRLVQLLAQPAPEPAPQLALAR